MPQAVDFNALFETYRSSVFNKDVDALMALYDKDIVAFDLWGAWRYAGDGPWREVNRDWLTTLGSESVVVEFDDIVTRPGDTIAVAYATVTYKAVAGSGEILRSMQNRLTWVVERKTDGWKIVHQHTSAPIDPDTMSVILQRK